jgi:hypothetical protein
VTFDGKVVLAQDFEIVYFEISRKWFTVVKVWNTRGEHTGYYCDIVTPFRMLSDDVIEQRDLFLDLWVSPDLRFKVLDQDELENALEKGWITKQLYEKAKKELERLVQSVKSKEFPPKLVIQLAEKLQL